MGFGTGRHRETSGGRHVPPRDHQAVPRRHRIGIGDAQRQFILQQHPAAALQRAEHTGHLAAGVAGLQAAEVCATSCVGKQPSRLAALQRKQRACRLLKSSEPQWFFGTMWSTSRARCCGICQATACAAAFAAALARVSTRTFTEPLIGVRWRLLCPKPQASA
jgi:hypothetical protein